MNDTYPSSSASPPRSASMISMPCQVADFDHSRVVFSSNSAWTSGPEEL